MSTDVAVVVVTYNSAAALESLAASLAGQVGDADELVVVDNASSDGTPALARRLGLRVLETGGNPGFAAACRLGVAATRAPLVFLLNPDARVADGALARLRATAEAQPEWAAWQPVVLLPDGAVNTAGGVVHFLGIGWAGRCGDDPATLPQQPYETAFASGAALVVRRTAWEEMDGLRDDYFLYGEDLDLGLRLWLAGHRVGVEPRARVHHDYEFDKGPQKWFLLERNRWRTVIATYPLALLVAVAPALLAAEVGLLVVAARGGWLREKLARAAGDARRPAAGAGAPPRGAAHAPRRRGASSRPSSPASLDSRFAAGAAPIAACVGAYWRLVRRRVALSARSAAPASARNPDATYPCSRVGCATHVDAALVGALPGRARGAGAGLGLARRMDLRDGGGKRADDPAGPGGGDRRRRDVDRLLGDGGGRGAGGGDRRCRRPGAGVAAHADPCRGADRRGRGARDLRGAGDPQRRGDLPRLRAPRRHGDLARLHRSVLWARALAVLAAELHLPAAAVHQPDDRGISPRRVHAARRRALDHRHRRGVDLPAVRGGVRRGARALLLRSARADRAERLVARLRRVHRGAVGAAVRLRGVGWDQGADGGVPARAGDRARGPAAARGAPGAARDRRARDRRRRADRHARRRRGDLRRPGVPRPRGDRRVAGRAPRRPRVALPHRAPGRGRARAARLADAVRLPEREQRVRQL